MGLGQRSVQDTTEGVVALGQVGNRLIIAGEKNIVGEAWLIDEVEY